MFFRFAQENDLIFLETSAKTGESVEEAFLKCSKTILAKIETGELDPERIGSGKIHYPFQFRKYGYGKIYNGLFITITIFILFILIYRYTIWGVTYTEKSTNQLTENSRLQQFTVQILVYNNYNSI